MFYRLWEELTKPGSFASRDYASVDLDNPAAEHNLTAHAFPDFQPEFGPVILTRDSSLVDFIDNGGSIGGKGLLVSENVLSILETMKLPPYQPYALQVVHKRKPVADRYFWLQILLIDNYGWIDFARSTFTRKSHFDMSESEGEPLEIASEFDLKKLIEASGPEDFWIHFSRITLNSVYARAPFDLFYMDHLGGIVSGVPLINEKLKAAFEKENIAGYALVERPDIVIEAS